MITCKEHCEKAPPRPPPPYVQLWTPDQVRRESRAAVSPGCWAASVVNKDRVRDSTIWHIMFPSTQYFNISAFSHSLLSKDAAIPAEQDAAEGITKREFEQSFYVMFWPNWGTEVSQTSEWEMRQEEGEDMKFISEKSWKKKEGISAEINRKDSSADKTQAQKMILSNCLDASLPVEKCVVYD